MLWSSARAMGRHVKGGVALCYGFALAGWGGALWAVRPDPLVLVALVPAAVHFTGQVVTLEPDNGEDALIMVCDHMPAADPDFTEAETVFEE